MVSSRARAYVDYPGSPLDEPAEALEAGDHGVPGGGNMLQRADSTVCDGPHPDLPRRVSCSTAPGRR